MWLILALLLGDGAQAKEGARPPLRVCADPNNLPFSNARGEGLENEIAQLLAEGMGTEVVYFWWPQRRGFLRETLRAGRCDLVLGVPAGLDGVATTRPYYRARYTFVTRAGGPRPPSSFDDPRLRTFRVGVPLVGDDGANPPPVHALARRGIVDNVRGYSVLGDYRRESPPLDILAALSRGEIDVAIVWGPLAGYLARRRPGELRLARTPIRDGALPLAFDIAAAVRPGDSKLRDQIDDVLRARRLELARILDRYGIEGRPKS